MDLIYFKIAVLTVNGLCTIYLPWLFGAESSWLEQSSCYIYMILLSTSFNKTSLKFQPLEKTERLGLGCKSTFAANQC
jgi:hypothetical protein